MSKKQIANIVFLILLIIGWAWVEQSAKRTDWSPTFYSAHKIPFGTYVLYDNLNELFPSAKVKNSNESFYQIMNSSDSLLTESCLICITNSFDADSLEVSKLNRFIENGNTVFLSAQFFPKELLDKDSSSFKVKFTYSNLNLKNKNSKLSYTTEADNIHKELVFNKMQAFSYFELTKNTNIKVIGEENEKPCFIEIKKGKGRLFLHTQPLAFTNYHILYNHQEYAEWVFSVVQPNVKTIIWDNYHTPFSTTGKTPLKIILSNPALKSALYLLLILLVIYILIFSKRKQRIIPIVRPQKNMSLSFIDTIGRLYFQKGNHRNLIEKQFVQFNYYVKTKYFISQTDNKDEFIERLALKSGVAESIIREIYFYYSKLKTKETVSEHELHTFNKLIKRFQQNTIHK